MTAVTTFTPYVIAEYQKLSPIEIQGQYFLAPYNPDDFNQLVSERFLTKALHLLNQDPFATAGDLDRVAQEALKETQQFFEGKPDSKKKEDFKPFHLDSFKTEETNWIGSHTNNRTVVETVDNRRYYEKNGYYFVIHGSWDKNYPWIKAFAIHFDRTLLQPFTIIDIENGAPRLFKTGSACEVADRIGSWSPYDRNLKAYHVKDVSHGSLAWGAC